MVNRPNKIDKTAQSASQAIPSKAAKGTMQATAARIKSLGATSILNMGGSLKPAKAYKERSIKPASSPDKIANIKNLLNFKKK